MPSMMSLGLVPTMSTELPHVLRDFFLPREASLQVFDLIMKHADGRFERVPACLHLALEVIHPGDLLPDLSAEFLLQHCVHIRHRHVVLGGQWCLVLVIEKVAQEFMLLRL